VQDSARAQCRNTPQRWRLAVTDALIIDACRTTRGIGKQGKGALADMHPQHLAVT
jgi:hypothetical protein